MGMLAENLFAPTTSRAVQACHFPGENLCLEERPQVVSMLALSYFVYQFEHLLGGHFSGSINGTCSNDSQ